MMRESFIFYKSFYNAIEFLGEKAQLKLYKSIMKLNFNCCENETELIQLCDEIETELKQKRQAFAQFLLIKPQLLANFQKYLNGCKGGQYGSLGGAQKGNKNAKKQPQNNPKTTPNENEQMNNVNVNVKGGMNPPSIEIQNQDSFFGEYQNVYLEKEDYKKILAICLDKTYLNELIEELSGQIEVGRYPIYDEKRPHAHLAILKRFHDQRRLNPRKFNKKKNIQSEDEIDPIVARALKRKLESERLNE